MVSHDRFFIDQIATTIYEIEYRKCTKYKGNYSDYIDQKAVAYSSLMKQYEKQQKEISKMEDFISRNIVRASTTKQAQSRRKKLEKMERIEIPKINDKSIGITFEIDRRSGNDVLKVENLSVGYDNQVITDDLNFQINRLDRVALIGPNGIGKSTILKTVAQTLPPLKGDIYYGKSLDMGYFDQEQANLNSSNTVLNEVWNCFPGRLEKDIRTLLGNFLFTGDDVFKTVNQLSGGEKVRLTLCKLMLEKKNFLLLDEPTNHLDIDSKEMLELSLEVYEGTVFFISHDRYFIDKIATRVLEVTPHGVTSYIGNYSDYTEKKQQLAEKEAALQAENSKKNDESTITDYQKQKEQRRLEQQRKRQLEDIETKISEYEEELAYNQAELIKKKFTLIHKNQRKFNHALKNLNNY
ncbi:MAG: ATP-binding cassette domain-containing protein [Turicibacter sanguinis]